MLQAIDDRLVALSAARERADHRLVEEVLVVEDVGVAGADGFQGGGGVDAERQPPGCRT